MFLINALSSGWQLVGNVTFQFEIAREESAAKGLGGLVVLLVFGEKGGIGFAWACSDPDSSVPLKASTSFFVWGSRNVELNQHTTPHVTPLASKLLGSPSHTHTLTRAS